MNIFEKVVDVLKGYEGTDKHVGFVFLNEQHSLMDQQVSLLNEKFGEDNWVTLPVPAKGWTLDEQDNIADELAHYIGGHVSDDIDVEFIFASPVPFLLKELTLQSKTAGLADMVVLYTVSVFHNDNREKKELPNGKVIFTVAKTGWQIV